MMGLAWYALFFVIAIGVLVTVHEFGHFIVARMLGVKVLRFSVGFGRPLASWRAKGDGTEYVLAALPLGGYVKMLDEREGEVAPEDRPRAFNRKPLAVRTAVVLAGPAFNFLFAALAYWLVFVLGVTSLKPIVGEVAPESVAARAGLAAGDEIVAIEGEPTPTWESVIQTIIGQAIVGESLEGGALEVEVAAGAAERRALRLGLGGLGVDDLTRGQFFSALGLEPMRPRIAPVIGHVEPGAPAEAAGLEPGDRVVAANGEPIDDWAQWVDHVRAHPGQTLEIEVERGGRSLTLYLTPMRKTEGDTAIGYIGAGVEPQPELFEQYYARVHYSPLDAIGRAVARTYETSALTLRVFWKMLQLEVSLSNLSGPISIAQYAGDTARMGASRFFELLAVVSVSLAILNLLPIPVLDGGHLLYYLVELVKGRPVSEEAQFIGQRFGIAMLFGLMGLAFYNDLARLFG